MSILVEIRILFIIRNNAYKRFLIFIIHNVRDLVPRQTYAVRVASANIVGLGLFSSVVDMATLEGN